MTTSVKAAIILLTSIHELLRILLINKLLIEQSFKALVYKKCILINHMLRFVCFRYNSVKL